MLHALMLDAQAEIGRLRAELYSTSRLADERKCVLRVRERRSCAHVPHTRRRQCGTCANGLPLRPRVASAHPRYPVHTPRQALDAMTAARDQLAAVAHQLEDKVQAMQAQVGQLPALQQQLHALQEQQQQRNSDKAMQQQVRFV